MVDFPQKDLSGSPPDLYTKKQTNRLAKKHDFMS